MVGSCIGPQSTEILGGEDRRAAAQAAELLGGQGQLPAARILDINQLMTVTSESFRPPATP